MDRALFSIEEACARLGGNLVFLGVFVYASVLSALFLPHRPFGQALGIDLALLAVFAVQHRGMARPAFKRWLTHRP